jgi:hypothetical protein
MLPCPLLKYLEQCDFIKEGKDIIRGFFVADQEPRAEIKLPPGTESTNCGSGSFLFTRDLKKEGSYFRVSTLPF